MLNQFFLLLLS